MQLGQLQSQVGGLRALGVEVFAISNDNRADARRMATQARLDFPVLSDPPMEVISGYGMQSKKMLMADMGYVLIDARGRVRVRRIDRQFGERAGEIVEALRRIT